MTTEADVPAAPVVVVPTVVVAITPIRPGSDQVKDDVVLELTKAIETQTSSVGAGGGDIDQPDGSVPVFVRKFQEPPVGVAGCELASWKMNHSKYVPPNTVLLPYKPEDSEPD